MSKAEFMHASVFLHRPHSPVLFHQVETSIKDDTNITGERARVGSREHRGDVGRDFWPGMFTVKKKNYIKYTYKNQLVVFY